ncbi:EAL domain-containing protein [Rhodocyclus tenuis]|uniref:EAL domain-containing protein n=1 Tax=Rhodocyclus gracilis TaxID=2929842 RepID=UPI001298B40F|nr:EAL domain-containing protein [Rhodocyclus gracilis]MRD71832.1 EAL domain-containing protein [Rhodocyclus gracilis]
MSRPERHPHPHSILECLLAERFGVEYQPLVCVKSGETRCHEALARFIDAAGVALPPEPVFEALHDNPLLLLHAELRTKQLQLDEAPTDGLIFVNLDPDSFAAGDIGDGHNVFTPMLAAHRERLVVEAIENLHLQDVILSCRMIDALASADIRIAVDDLSSSRGLISYASLMNATVVKFDRSWLNGELTPRQRKLLVWALAQAKDLGLTTVLEGVETEAHWQQAKTLEFDLVQGFLFAERFIRRGCTARTAATPTPTSAPTPVLPHASTRALLSRPSRH